MYKYETGIEVINLNTKVQDCVSQFNDGLRDSKDGEVIKGVYRDLKSNLSIVQRDFTVALATVWHRNGATTDAEDVINEVGRKAIEMLEHLQQSAFRFAKVVRWHVDGNKAANVAKAASLWQHEVTALAKWWADEMKSALL